MNRDAPHCCPGSHFSATRVIHPPTPSAWQHVNHINGAFPGKRRPKPREANLIAWSHSGNVEKSTSTVFLGLSLYLSFLFIII